MGHRMVGDLMTTPVVSVRRDTGFKEIAKLLAEHDITAVPVVDDDEHAVGVVSEADLLRKEAGPTAGGLMHSPAVTARPQWTAVEAAQVMERRHVKRLPVVDEGDRLVGLVSRADLLRVFLRGDSAIREEISGEVLLRTLGVAPGAVTVRVVDGRVSLKGTVERRSLVPAVVRLCQDVDGVVDVSAELRHRVDDTASALAEPGTPRRAGLAT
ncbi:CBS domain-containing protein [Streptomyces sp. SS7]|uniref:CBS domain-containing protein n=1 Tax=Streptomyces sp. SS7 TaxID=3108485 RepID=UPI0030EF40A9